MKMYFLFLIDVMEPMNDFNTAFQVTNKILGPYPTLYSDVYI